MSEQNGAPPPEEQQDGTTAQDPAATGNAAQEPEVDFDRILAGDEAYIAETNQKLAGSAPVETPAATDDGAKQKEAAPAAAKEETPPETEPDNILIFRGKEVPIPADRKKQKELMQKGLALDARLGELSHLIALEREVPDVAKLAKTPEGRKQIVERIRQKQAGEDEDLGLEVPGYDKDDVAAVDSILKARMKKLGIEPRRDGPTPEQAIALEADQKELERETALTLRVMKRVDPDFSPKMQLLRQIMAKAQVELPPEQYNDLFNKINDVRNIHPDTGEPVFNHFWDNVVTPEYRKLQQSTKPAAPAVPAIPPKTQESAGRMAPGSAHAPTGGASVNDLSKLSDDAFNRVMDEVKARG